MFLAVPSVADPATSREVAGSVARTSLTASRAISDCRADRRPNPAGAACTAEVSSSGQAEQGSLVRDAPGASVRRELVIANTGTATARDVRYIVRADAEGREASVARDRCTAITLWVPLAHATRNVIVEKAWSFRQNDASLSNRAESVRRCSRRVGGRYQAAGPDSPWVEVGIASSPRNRTITRTAPRYTRPFAHRRGSRTPGSSHPSRSAPPSA